MNCAVLSMVSLTCRSEVNDILQMIGALKFEDERERSVWQNIKSGVRGRKHDISVYIPTILIQASF